MDTLCVSAGVGPHPARRLNAAARQASKPCNASLISRLGVHPIARQRRGSGRVARRADLRPRLVITGRSVARGRPRSARRARLRGHRCLQGNPQGDPRACSASPDRMRLMTLTIAIIINALLDIAILGALAFTTSRGAKLRPHRAHASPLSLARGVQAAGQPLRANGELVDLPLQPARLKVQSAQRDRRAEPRSALGHRAGAA